jgi:Domain of unknown function (DUF5104)
VRMKQVLGAGVALACVALLSSCSLLPGGADDPTKQADVEMGRIADAVNHHDATALKKLFSNAARAKAIGLDSGVKALLSAFPSGITSWKQTEDSPGENIETDFGKETLLLSGYIKVQANGKEYELNFLDYAVNQIDDPNNVGLYAIGVAPYTTDPYTSSGAKKPLEAWDSQFGEKDHQATGDPGVFISQK